MLGSCHIRSVSLISRQGARGDRPSTPLVGPNQVGCPPSGIPVIPVLDCRRGPPLLRSLANQVAAHDEELFAGQTLYFCCRGRINRWKSATKSRRQARVSRTRCLPRRLSQYPFYRKRFRQFGECICPHLHTSTFPYSVLRCTRAPCCGRGLAWWYTLAGEASAGLNPD